MRIRLPAEAQKGILNRAVEKAGSERKLVLATGIPKSSIYDYARNKRILSSSRFQKLLDFLNEKIESSEIQYVPDNWGQIKGGKRAVEEKIRNGTFEKQLQTARKTAAKTIIAWHHNLRENNPVLYYKIQHQRFSISGKYKYQTTRGEQVRNTLEQEVANFLFSKGLEYQYEPYVPLLHGGCFPDFRLDSVIIECTMWKHESKALQLSEKINALEAKGYAVIVFIPTELRHFYKQISSYIVSDFQELERQLCPGSSATTLK